MKIVHISHSWCKSSIWATNIKWNHSANWRSITIYICCGIYYKLTILNTPTRSTHWNPVQLIWTLLLFLLCFFNILIFLSFSYLILTWFYFYFSIYCIKCFVLQYVLILENKLRGLSQAFINYTVKLLIILILILIALDKSTILCTWLLSCWLR